MNCNSIQLKEKLSRKKILQTGISVKKTYFISQMASCLFFFFARLSQMVQSNPFTRKFLTENYFSLFTFFLKITENPQNHESFFCAVCSFQVSSASVSYVQNLLCCSSVFSLFCTTSYKIITKFLFCLFYTKWYKISTKLKQNVTNILTKITITFF